MFGNNKNNKIYIIGTAGKKKLVRKIKGLKVKFYGSDSTVIVHEPLADFLHSSISCGSNCSIEISSSSHRINNLVIFAEADNVQCFIGKNFSCTNRCHILLHREPGLSVRIGEDCMFGTNVVLRTTDAHTIYSLDTGKVENFGGSIEIGNHCWLALDVIVMKNVKIADNIVIGTHSVVTKNCDTPNSIYVGSPAKMVKTNINWDRRTPVGFDKENTKL